MVFTISLGSDNFLEHPFESTVLIVSITFVLALAGAALLLYRLPHVLGSYSLPVRTLSNVLSVPVARRSVAWAAAAFAVASFVTVASPPGPIDLMMNEGMDDLESQLQTASVVAGFGVLIWGIAADFYSVRRLFLVAGLLLIPAAGVLWVLNCLSAASIGVSVLGLAHSGLICLPWLLMADLLPSGHFAKIAVAITLVGGFLGSSLGATAMGLASAHWDFDVTFLTATLGGIMVAFVASRIPRPLPTDALVYLEEKSRTILVREHSPAFEIRRSKAASRKCKGL